MTINNVKQRIFDNLTSEEIKTYNFANKVNLMEGMLISIQPIAIGLFLYHAYNNTVTNPIIYTVLAITMTTFLLRYFLGFRIGAKMYYLGYNCILKLRLKVLKKILKLPISSLQKVHVGKVSMLLSEEMVFFEMYITFARAQKMIAIANVISLLILITLLSPPLSGIAFIIVGIMYILSSVFKKRIGKGLKTRNINLSDANRHIMEYVQGMQIIRAFNSTAKQNTKYNHYVHILRDNFLKIIKSNSKIGFSILMVLELSVAVITIGFSYLWLNDMINPLNGIAILIILVSSFSSLDVVKMSNTIDALINITNNNINEIEDYPSTEWGEKSLENKSYDIEFDNVKFSYDKKSDVLKGVSFTARAKAMTAIVGSSGAGKTTVLKLISRFWDVNSGEIKIGGENINELTEEALIKQLSIVSQDVKLFNQSVYNNIALGDPNAKKEDIIRVAKKAQAYDFIMKLENGFDTLVGEGGKNLSGGERQRISIARAILKNSPVVLLDEATSAIDPENEELIQLALNELIKKKTIIVIAHKLSTIVNANNIIVMKDGKIESQGKHSTLLQKSPLYKKLWENHKDTSGWKI